MREIPNHDRDEPINSEQVEQSIPDSQREIEREFPKPVTLEVLQKNKDLLKIVCDKIDECNRQELNRYDPMDLGQDYEKVSLDNLMFCVACQLGVEPNLDAWNDSKLDPNTEEYLKKLLAGDEQRAKSVINRPFARWGQNKLDEKTREWIKKGSNLSLIIPGAPEMIQAGIKQMEKDKRPTFSSRDTSKVPDILKFLNTEGEKTLHDIFKNKAVVDLGAGSWSEGLKVSQQFGAKNYVGVEPYSAYQLLSSAISRKERGELNNIDNMHIAATDMLSFLKRLPDKAKNLVILMSGIDNYIFGTSQFDNEEGREKGVKYVEEVFSEIRRVMGKDCDFVSYASFAPHKTEGFKEVAKVPCFESPIYVFEGTD